jgi:hypothetical protein
LKKNSEKGTRVSLFLSLSLSLSFRTLTAVLHLHDSKGRLLRGGDTDAVESKTKHDDDGIENEKKGAERDLLG